MGDWDREIGAMTLLVADLGASKNFYQDAFGLTAQHEDAVSVMFRFKDMYVFLRKAPVTDGPPADYVLDLAKGGAGQFAIIVDDVDEVSSELAERGVPVISGPADRDWGMRTLTFADPSGHVWEIAQPVSSS